MELVNIANSGKREGREKQVIVACVGEFYGAAHEDVEDVIGVKEGFGHIFLSCSRDNSF